MAKNDSCDIETGICLPDNGSSQNMLVKTSVDSLAEVKLTYYYDALCGWCYGFSPVMSKLQDEFGDKLDIEVISGGLFLGNRAGLINEVAPHIKAGAYKNVEDRTGVKFGETFLADVYGEGKMTLNSILPAVALCIVKEKFAENKLKFAAMLLEAVYSNGMNPIDIEMYADYAVKIGFEREEFNSKMLDPKYKDKALKEFEYYKSQRINGFPAVVIETEDEKNILSRGYINYDELKNRLVPYLE